VLLFLCLGLLLLVGCARPAPAPESFPWPESVPNRTDEVKQAARDALRAIVAAQTKHFAVHGRYGSLADRTGADPSLLPARYREGADVGLGVIVTLTTDGARFTATAGRRDADPATHTYTADETGTMEQGRGEACFAGLRNE
jgi:hypothetical protein